MEAVSYFNALAGKTLHLWTFTHNCFGEIAAIQWCNVFNKYEDCTHFKQLFGDPTINAIAAEFDLENVRRRLRSAVALTPDEYKAFRQGMVEFRNACAAHLDYRKEGLVFPDLDVASNLCVEMRDILRQLVVKIVSDGSSRGNARPEGTAHLV